MKPVFCAPKRRDIVTVVLRDCAYSATDEAQAEAAVAN